MEHRRLKILFAVIAIFAFGVIIWYFLFSNPKDAPTLSTTQNPLPLGGLAARVGLIFQNDNAPTTTTETEVTPQSPQPFVRVWDKPSSGNTFVARTYLKEVTATSTVATSTGTTTLMATKAIRATSTILMFVDRMTGYVYGYNTDDGTTYQISNTTVPGVHDAYIWDGGTKVLMRSLDANGRTITSFLASIPDVQQGHDPQPLVRLSTLPNNISTVAISASGKFASYGVPNDLGMSVYALSAKGSSHVGDSPFSQWTLSYGGENLYATTKPSAYVEGVMVSLPSFSRVIGGKTGLSSIAGTSNTFLSSMWSSSGLATFLVKNGSIVPLSLKTIATKCSSVGTTFFCGIPKALPQKTEGLPDDWYQGRTSFDDTLSIINGQNGEIFNLFNFDQKYGDMDVTSVEVSAKEDLISFVRKQDGSLFLLNTNLLGD